MKIQRLLRSLLFTFSVAFGLFATAATEAGSLSWVHVFPANDPNSGKALQGATPRALAKGTDGNFYGIADGGTNGEGIFFQITPAGTFTILLNSPSNIPLTATNSLAAVKNDASGRMVFYAPGVGYNQFLRIISDGTPANTSVEDILSLFNSSNIGTSIRGGLLYDGEDANGKSILYGTTYALGPNNKGSLFKIVTNNTNAGTSATVLHAFGSGDDNSQDDGFAPVVRPVKGSDGNLYGIVSDLPYAFDPPGTDSGKIYRYNLSTGTFHVLYTFPLNSASGLSELVESSSGIFFGVSKSPTGTNGGYIFKVAVSGPTAAVTVAHAFTVPGDESGRLIIDSDGLMYGAQPAGGAHQNGSIYDFTPDGTVTTLFEFSAGYPKNADGIEPQVYALDADGNIYGAAIVGGTNGNGTVFKLNAPPKPPLPSFTSFDAQQTSTDDGAPIHFTATMQSGVKITVQFSTNPSDPTSWSPLIDTGIMNEQPPGSGNYVLDSDAYPTGKVSFRAVATKPGSTRSLSDNKG
ncbi:MAG: choice-of-anchor tandem repeat GloVer-containing protein, partial [Chthoniobacterales bacterium]